MESLNLNPLAKAAILIYSQVNDEEYADTTDEGLLQTYHYVNDNNLWSDVWECERLNNPDTYKEIKG